MRKRAAAWACHPGELSGQLGDSSSGPDGGLPPRRPHEIRDEADIIRGLDRGELEHEPSRISAPASGPPDISNQLRLIAQADALRQSADAQAQHDRPVRPEPRLLPNSWAPNSNASKPTTPDTSNGPPTPKRVAIVLFGLNLTQAAVIARGRSVVGVGEGRLAAFVERTDAFDSVGMDGRAPVRLHHDGDRLLDRLPLAHPDRLLDRLYRSR
jgi:hypothetical protein